MEYKLIDCIIDSPIERIRGSENIRVSVCCTFLFTGREYKVSGFSLVGSDKENDLQDGFLASQRNAETNFKKLIESNKITEGQTPEPLINIVKELLEPKLDTQRKEFLEKINKSTNKSRDLQRIEGPADEPRQNKINELCEALGIAPINVLGDNPWSFLESVALIAELKLKMDKFKAKE